MNISQSLTLQPLPSEECDDEDDCKPSYSGNGNEEMDHSVGNGDFKGLSPSKVKSILKCIALFSEAIGCNNLEFTSVNSAVLLCNNYIFTPVN